MNRHCCFLVDTGNYTTFPAPPPPQPAPAAGLPIPPPPPPPAVDTGSSAVNQAPVAALHDHVSEEPVSSGSDRKRTLSLFADGEELDFPDEGGDVAGFLAEDETPPGNYLSSPIHTCDGTPLSTNAKSPEDPSVLFPSTNRPNPLDFTTLNAFLEECSDFPSDDSIPSD